jgi:hypothetical protein
MCTYLCVPVYMIWACALFFLPQAFRALQICMHTYIHTLMANVRGLCCYANKHRCLHTRHTHHHIIMLTLVHWHTHFSPIVKAGPMSSSGTSDSSIRRNLPVFSIRARFCKCHQRSVFLLHHQAQSTTRRNLPPGAIYHQAQSTIRRNLPPGAIYHQAQSTTRRNLPIFLT